MIIQDDRTDAEKQTHQWAVVGTDRFMSGWGKASGGPSYAAWAYEYGQRAQILANVKNRSDMMRVRMVYLPNYRPKGPGHCHIYVFNPTRLEPYFVSAN